MYRILVAVVFLLTVAVSPSWGNIPADKSDTHRHPVHVFTLVSQNETPVMNCSTILYSPDLRKYFVPTGKKDEMLSFDVNEVFVVSDEGTFSVENDRLLFYPDMTGPGKSHIGVIIVPISEKGIYIVEEHIYDAILSTIGMESGDTLDEWCIMNNFRVR